MPRKTTARTQPPADQCPACKGSGTVPVSVRVGRRRRNVGQQDGICLGCLGTGTAPEA